MSEGKNVREARMMVYLIDSLGERSILRMGWLAKPGPWK